MSYNSVMLILGLSLLVLGANSKTLNFIDPCPINDDACTLASAKKAMPYIVLGNKDLGIESLDPMTFKTINGDIETLKITILALTVNGAKECDIIAVRRPVELEIYVEVVCPISAHGKHRTKGDIAGYKVSGEGGFEFSASKLNLTATIALGVVDGKDGEKHYKVVKFDFTYEPIGEITFELKNLFNGDEAQAAPVYKLFKEQPKEMFNLVGKKCVQEIVKKVVHAVARVLDRAPIQEING